MGIRHHPDLFVGVQAVIEHLWHFQFSIAEYMKISKFFIFFKLLYLLSSYRATELPSYRAMRFKNRQSSLNYLDEKPKTNKMSSSFHCFILILSSFICKPNQNLNIFTSNTHKTESYIWTPGTINPQCKTKAIVIVVVLFNSVHYVSSIYFLFFVFFFFFLFLWLFFCHLPSFIL